MPIYLPPISRRELLAKSATASTGLAALSFFPELVTATNVDKKRDPSNWLLWSDPHIDQDKDRGKKKNKDYYMYKNFVAVTNDVIKNKKNAAGIFINGDCANLYGKPKDYEVLAELLEPLSKAGFPIHMTMGNHDSRHSFRNILKKHRPNNPSIKGKRIGVVEAKDANWILLDSLKVINGSPGELGSKQIEWLKAELDKRKDKPAIIMLHHNPKLGKHKRADSIGLKDTNDFFEIVKPRKNVKAIVFGHTHHWGLYKVDGIHLINLPAIGRIFREEEPLGWVDATLKPDGIKLELRALDTKHKAHGEKHELSWRK